jgi:hypothetical protein
MKGTTRVCSIAAGVGVVLAAFAGTCTPDTVDATTAKQTAAAFAEAVDLPWAADQVETSEKLDAGRYGDRHHFVLKYFGFTEIAVDATDGAIVNVQNRSAVTQFLAEPTRVKLTEEEALARADQIAQAMAISVGDTAFRDVKLNEFTADEHYMWQVRWHRMCANIPYDSDGAIVMLDPETGNLLGAGKAFWARPPASTEVKIDSDEALSIARQQAAALALQETDLPPSVELRVVQPNNYWDLAEPVEIPHTGFSRVAWVVTFSVPSALGGPDAVAHTVFWIDAADGRLLGGARSGG